MESKEYGVHRLGFSKDGLNVYQFAQQFAIDDELGGKYYGPLFTPRMLELEKAIRSEAVNAQTIYFHDAHQLYVNLFIPSEVKWQGTVIRQTTRFPEDPHTIITSSSKINLKLRYPAWATYMKVNGRRVTAGADGYILIKNTKKVVVEFGMTLHEEATKDDKSRVALLYGPVVLGGRLSAVAHPFSNPKNYNDYYTFDYGQHPDISLSAVKHLGGLRFQSDTDISIEPLFNLQHCRYVVYWKK